MSGALSALSSLGSGRLGGALSGLLAGASFRGVRFEVLDSRHAAGRRWVQFLFPGRDDTVQQDLGAVDGLIELNALVIGSDWLRRQRRLEAACKAPGPGTLVHPWLGTMQVTLAQPAEFGFDHQQGLVCTVRLACQVWTPRPLAPTTTLGRLLDAVDGAMDAARGFLASALAPLGDALGVIASVQGTLADVAGVWSGLLGTSAGGIGLDSTGALAAAAAAPIDAATGGVALVSDATGLGLQVADLSAAIPQALAGAADSAADPAVGPGPLEPDPAPVADPLSAGAVLLAGPALLQPPPGALPLTNAVLQAARVQAVAQAARAASGAAWSDQTQATLWRGRVDTALAAEQIAAANAAQGAIWRALRDLRTAWARDMTVAIGRLPAVGRIRVLAPVSAWQITLATAGEDPAAFRPALLDFLRRNRIRHPGLLAPGLYEVLGGPTRAELSDPPVQPISDRADAVAIGGAVMTIGGEPIAARPGTPVPADADPFALSLGGTVVTIGGDTLRVGP